MHGVMACVQGDGKLRSGLTPDEMRAALRDDHALLWVDIEADGRENGEPILRDVFGFHALTIDDCYNDLIDPPKVDDYTTYLFAIFHNIVDEDDGETLRTNELNLYLGANYVVSVHRSHVRAIDEVRRRAEQNALVMDHGAAFLAHALIDVVVDDFHPVVDRIDEQVLAIEERVLADPRSDTLEQVLRLKRTAQRLRRSILPQRDVMNRFSRGEYPLIPREALIYFRDIYDHTVRVEETIDSMRDLADSALNTYLSSVNNRTNEVMKTLALVTVVFLPLTLIAGIYGTNFENVPEYAGRYAYPTMLAAMVVIAVGLIVWFRRQRWF